MDRIEQAFRVKQVCTLFDGVTLIDALGILEACKIEMIETARDNHGMRDMPQ